MVKQQIFFHNMCKKGLTTKKNLFNIMSSITFFPQNLHYLAICFSVQSPIIFLLCAVLFPGHLCRE